MTLRPGLHPDPRAAPSSPSRSRSRKKDDEEARAKSERSGMQNVTRKACVQSRHRVVMTMKMARGTKFKSSLPFYFYFLHHSCQPFSQIFQGALNNINAKLRPWPYGRLWHWNRCVNR